MDSQSNNGLSRLQVILTRAKRAAALTKTARQKLRAANRDRKVSEDYADRLAEKAKFRKLLTDEQMDGWRFRWYFTHVQKDLPLEQLREWIDAKVATEEEAAA